MEIKATIIQDSVNSFGHRLTTMRLHYPRFVHAQFMTHRMISKNSASSRAIPTKSLIESIRTEPAVPQWRKNKPGMQSDVALDLSESIVADSILERYRESTFEFVSTLQDPQCLKIHKEYANRYLEPHMMMEVIASFTDINNATWLRYHDAAQPQISELFKEIHNSMNRSIPTSTPEGFWHVPFVGRKMCDKSYEELVRINEGEVPDLEAAELYSNVASLISWKDWVRTRIYREGGMTIHPLYYHPETYQLLTEEQALKLSTSLCAQVSYRKEDSSLSKAEDIHSKLFGSYPIHASPSEHQALPMSVREYSMRYDFYSKALKEGFHDPEQFFYCGNFRGWVQYRKLLKNENIRLPFNPEKDLNDLISK